jgi:N-acetylglucosaminyldiphosphoundecaprenol N-acetyl-beta-D-mannosaminyltransferase
MPLDPVTQEDVIVRIIEGVARAEGGAVLTAHLESLRQYLHDPATRRAMDAADLVVADGMPIVWGSQLKGTPVPDRVAGSTMIWPLTAAAAAADIPVFLLGGDPGVAEEAAHRFGVVFPHLRIAGIDESWIDGDSPDIEAVVKALAGREPTLVYVALPWQKQVRVIPELRRRLPVCWFVGVGISLSFVSRRLTRAPLWAQRMGMEWLHRLMHEPRLYRRYLVDDPPVAARLVLSGLRERMRPESTRAKSASYRAAMVDASTSPAAAAAAADSLSASPPSDRTRRDAA